MIPVKIGHIYDARFALSKFGEYNLPPDYGFKFSDFLIEAMNKIKLFELMQKNKIIEYNFKNKEGLNAVPEEKIEEFNAYISSARDAEFMFDIDKVKREVIIKNNNVIQPTITALMSFLIEKDNI